MRVLDVGCGVGGPAREIAHFTGAHVTGLNNNAYQLQRATHYAAKELLQDQTEFIKVNWEKRRKRKREDNILMFIIYIN
jgi:sterol 24-C-methyltransferase